MPGDGTGRRPPLGILGAEQRCKQQQDERFLVCTVRSWISTYGGARGGGGRQDSSSDPPPLMFAN
jgi:hypothetical protein